MELHRHLNGAVAALAAGEVVFASFSPADIGNAQAMRGRTLRRRRLRDGAQPVRRVSSCATACSTCSTGGRSRPQGDVWPQVTPFVGSRPTARR